MLERGDQDPGGRLKSLNRRLVLSLLAFPALVLIGAVGYSLIEGWSFSDALLMAATTIVTIGIEETQPLSPKGRLFTLGLIVVGVVAVWYAVRIRVSVVLADELSLRWEERRMQRKIRQLRGHHIVAGFGRVGRETAQSLRALGQQVVVIEADPVASADAITAGFPAVEGNATEDATLSLAGIDRAAGLVAAFGSDAENAFVTLSARALNPTLLIVARANEAGAAPKLARAGATRVVFPYDKTGRHMARLTLRAETVDEIERIFNSATGDLLIEGIRVEANCPLLGATVGEARGRAPHAHFLAIRRDGTTVAPPPPDLRLAAGDVIAVVGAEAELRRLEELCQTVIFPGDPVPPRDRRR